MYYKWLDKWDADRTERGFERKRLMNFELGGNEAFPWETGIEDVDDFILAAQRARHRPDFFDDPSILSYDIKREGEYLTFTSCIHTHIPNNNLVRAKITESKRKRNAIILLHHWGASNWNSKIPKLLSLAGYTVVEMALPYHIERSRPDHEDSNYFFSPNIGLTIQSVRQAVIDGRTLISWLNDDGYESISLLGISIGSFMASIIAAFDERISKAALFMPSGNSANVVWTGPPMRIIKEGISKGIGFNELQKAWEIISPESYADKLARQGLQVSITLAKRDTVLIPKASEDFIERLKSAGVNLKILKLNCGHYSLGLPQYGMIAVLNLVRFLGKQ